MKKTILFLLTIFVPHIIFAYKVQPLNYDLTLNRGESTELELTLTGSKQDGLEYLSIYLTDLSMARDGSLLFPMSGGKYSAKDWIKLSDKRAGLSYKKGLTYKFKVSVPYTAKPGEYYSTIMLDPDDIVQFDVTEKKVSVGKKSRVAVVVLIKVPGLTTPKDAKVLESNFKMGETNKISATLENLSLEHLKVSGTASVTSKDGTLGFGTVPLITQYTKEGKTFVFPGSTIDFYGTLDRTLPSGEYVLEVSFDYGYYSKRATYKKDFFIKRDVPLDESKANFLELETTEIKMNVPPNSLRTKDISIINTDYRPITFTFDTDDWVKVKPSAPKITLKPGEKKGFRVVISISDYGGVDKKESKITVSPDRGISSEISVLVSNKEELLTNKN